MTDGADGPRFVTAIDAGQSVVSASGELDLASVEQLRDVLSPLSGQVIIDLSMVTYLDSSRDRRPCWCPQSAAPRWRHVAIPQPQ